MFADRDIEIIAAPDGRCDPVRDSASSPFVPDRVMAVASGPTYATVVMELAAPEPMAELVEVPMETVVYRRLTRARILVKMADRVSARNASVVQVIPEKPVKMEFAPSLV